MGKNVVAAPMIYYPFGMAKTERREYVNVGEYVL